ncbi:hypothetical protein HDU87_008631 [Geranomyces variabilis]|uniref:GON domain-containing protein n=1 Tax=Geranomyces variabilis TaxID=109894 RepID=A0AAD5TCK6_9FUNG|nr:hypothetical protein HDU87_008631 [Geranomyces variabilis]
MATSGQPITSCKDVQAGDKTATDDTYHTLQTKYDGQWYSVRAYCYGMNSTSPLEYVDVDSRYNRASFVSDGPTASATCRPARATLMSWARVRWFPAQGVLDLCDQRYANYIAGSFNTNLAVQSLGSSYSCSLTSTAPRNASIDLALTPFELDTTNPNTNPLRDTDQLVGLSVCGSYGSLNNNSISKPRALKVRIKAGTTPFTVLTPPDATATPLPDRNGGGSSSSVPIGVIVGVVVGILLACLVAAAVIWKIRKSRRNPDAQRRHSKSIYAAAPAAASAHDPPSPVITPAGAPNISAMAPVLPLAVGHAAAAASAVSSSSAAGRSHEYIGPALQHGNNEGPRRAITTVAWTSPMDNATPPPYLADGAAGGHETDYGAVNEKSIVLQQFVAEQPGELDLAVGDHVLVT